MRLQNLPGSTIRAQRTEAGTGMQRSRWHSELGNAALSVFPSSLLISGKFGGNPKALITSVASPFAGH